MPIRKYKIYTEPGCDINDIASYIDELFNEHFFLKYIDYVDIFNCKPEL
jgi:hypothetical protein